MKKYLFVSLLLLTAHCGGSDGGSDSGRFRLLQAIPIPTSFMVEFPEADRGFITEFSRVSEYDSLRVDEDLLQLRETISVVPVLEERIRIAEDRRITVVLVDELRGDDQFDVIQFTDDFSDPEDGEFRLRIIHLSNSLGSVDVYVIRPDERIAPIPPAVESLEDEDATRYLDGNLGVVEVILSAAGTKEIVYQTRIFEFNEERVYTLFILEDEQ